MAEPFKLPPIGGKGVEAEKMGPEEFNRWVQELGRQKVYTKTPYINQFGNETTFREEIDKTKESYANSGVDELMKLSKLPDSKFLQHLRRLANEKTNFMDPQWQAKDKNMQDALDKTPMS